MAFRALRAFPAHGSHADGIPRNTSSQPSVSSSTARGRDLEKASHPCRRSLGRILQSPDREDESNKPECWDFVAPPHRAARPATREVEACYSRLRSGARRHSRRQQMTRQELKLHPKVRQVGASFSVPSSFVPSACIAQSRPSGQMWRRVSRHERAALRKPLACRCFE